MSSQLLLRLVPENHKGRKALKKAKRTGEKKKRDKEAKRLRMAKKRKGMLVEQKERQRISNRNSIIELKQEIARKSGVIMPFQDKGRKVSWNITLPWTTICGLERSHQVMAILFLKLHMI